MGWTSLRSRIAMQLPSGASALFGFSNTGQIRRDIAISGARGFCQVYGTKKAPRGSTYAFDGRTTPLSAIGLANITAWFVII